MFELFLFGFTQGFVIGPITLFGIQEGIDPKKGFKYQSQVILGSVLVDIIYLLLATSGISNFVENNWVKLIMWMGSSYLLITMGANAILERKHAVSFHTMHRRKHHFGFFETDFVRALLINLINPLAIVFWVMVAGSIYASHTDISPSIFALTVVASSMISSFIIAGMTFILKKAIHNSSILQKITVVSSAILICYGLYFFSKAAGSIKVLASTF